MRLSLWSRQAAVTPWTPLPFLCPSLGLPATASIWRTSYYRRERAQQTSRKQIRSLYIESSREPTKRNLTARPTESGLPLTCPGCGAYSQTHDADAAGYYNVRRGAVRNALRTSDGELAKGLDATALDDKKEEERKIFETSLQQLDQDTRDSLGLPTPAAEPLLAPKPAVKTGDPVCDRCHRLQYHGKGVPIFHPDVSSIQDVLAQSPYKRNHIYHVVDAVDFPMSVIPRAHELLDAIQIGHNRRAKAGRHLMQGKPTLSFIITRSDLLAPNMEQVNHMMADLRDILVQTLGRRYSSIRIGTLRCVSSMRGWWTSQVKEEIQRRNGGTWMLGKVNVGKSSLIQTVFTKGAARTEAKETALYSPKAVQNAPSPSSSRTAEEVDEPIREEFARFSEDQTKFVLPPAAPETAFPTLPTISHLPGTTAQPIRLRFGNGKGELIDLPGLDRKDMTEYVSSDKQDMLVMRRRVKAEQQVIKPGQSLMIGDLVRITPKWPAWAEAEVRRNAMNESREDNATTHPSEDPVMLSASFVPFATHVTATEKAVEHQAQTRTAHPGFEQLLAPGAGVHISSAGTFKLKWDVTAKRTGPLTRADAAGLKVSRLPFVIFSADIVLEGIGWVELAVQVRRRQLEEQSSEAARGDRSKDSSDAVTSLPDNLLPAVEVFSPKGGHVMVRKPLNAYMLGGRRPKPKSQRSQRPRRSMVGVKKAMKVRTRQN